MFLLARRWLSRSDAILSAALYAANPYYLVIVYWRSAFAELLAGALLPLLLLQILELPDTRHRAVIPLGLLVAAAWLINAPSAVMINYSLAFLISVVAILRCSPQVLLDGTSAIMLGAGLAAFSIVPGVCDKKC